MNDQEKYKLIERLDELPFNDILDTLIAAELMNDIKPCPILEKCIARAMEIGGTRISEIRNENG